MNKKANARYASKFKDLDTPLVVASHFGFMPIESPRVTKKDIDDTSDCGTDPHYSAAEKAAFLRTYMEKNLSALPHPLGVAYKQPSRTGRGKAHTLELVGFPIGLAEALLIRTSLSILAETGHKHMVVDINCIGDKESISTYERELGSFLRRVGTNLTAEVKKELKKDIFSAAKLESAPPSIAFLSPESRRYFKEVLEYIESLDIEFRLAPELVGDKNYCSHTIFNIKDTSETSEPILSVGYCYHRLGKRFGLKKDVMLAGATVFSGIPASKSARPPSSATSTKKGARPSYYLVQLGRDAKMKALTTIEVLRQERIHVHHVLGKDKITAQLSHAEELESPYILLIGQKEALENTVTVRNVSTRAQHTVAVEDLPRFLKKLPA